MLVRPLPNGRSQIVKDEAFCELLNNQLPGIDQPITTLLTDFDARIRLVDPSATGGLNNAHGDWYEWLLALSSWNFCCANPQANMLLILPNINQFDVSRLYIPRLYDLVTDLRRKVRDATGVRLITSNPDFVIISRTLANQLIVNFDPFNEVTTNAITFLEGLYNLFTTHCDYEDILGYASVKSSLRPDRRLQIPHEGSLMKALYTHLQTREWITDPKGIRYYAISTVVGEPDIQALRTVATHSLTTVFSRPQAAVDAVFAVNSLRQAQVAFSQMLF